jgi:hypothetical protein
MSRTTADAPAALASRRLRSTKGANPNSMTPSTGTTHTTRGPCWTWAPMAAST